MPGMAVSAAKQCGTLNPFSCTRKEIGKEKKACVGISNMKYYQLFKMVEKWIQTEFSFVLKIEDHFYWTLKCNIYKVMLIIFQ